MQQLQQIFMCVHTCTYTCVRVFPEVISKAATKLFQECTGFKSCLWGRGGGWRKRRICKCFMRNVFTWEGPSFSVGVGIAMVAVSALTSLYYNMILAWAYYYFFASFTSNLPWVTCDNTWNTRGNTAHHTISAYEATAVLTQFGLFNLCCVIAGFLFYSLSYL